MSTFSLILQSARHYWKGHIGLLFGAFLASAILSGSLFVGDSVRASLARAAAQRLGKVESGMLGGDRWFTEDLARKETAAPVILMNASVSEASGKSRVNAVQVLGVDAEFWRLSPSGRPIFPENAAPTNPTPLAVNESLARRLGVKVGDTVVIRMERPSAISKDAPLSGSTNDETTLRRQVTAVVSAEDFGSFQLTASQTGNDTLFLPLAELQAELEKKGRVNAFLSQKETVTPAASGGASAHVRHIVPPFPLEGPVLEDFALKLAKVEGSGTEWELSTDRVFLDNALAEKVLQAKQGSYGVLTYLVNGLSSEKTKERTPYSMVTGIPAATFSALGVNMPESLAESGEQPAAISQWLAEDLNLALGDTFELRYFSVGLGRELQEKNSTFTVRGIIPMNQPSLNKAWTPEFPGVSDVDNCRDWQPGIPVKLDAIRDKDEKYWDDYHGTPKAFIPLGVGQRLWGNRFGNLTSVRFPFKGEDEAALRKELAALFKLSDIGLVPRDFRGEATAAAKGSVDFGGLFIGLSMFLIASALIFSALLFLFTLEKRIPQVGVLLAIGWKPKKVRWVLLGEAGVIALIGTALGLAGGMLYTKLALAGLNSVWSGATVGMKLIYQANPATVAIAFVSGILASMGILWLASRRLLKTTARELLAGEAWTQTTKKPGKPGRPGTATKPLGLLRGVWPALLSLVLAIGLSLAAGKASSAEAVAGMFFGAGFLLLLAGMLIIRRWLIGLETGGEGAVAPVAGSLGAIGLRNVTRRRGRSLSVIGMMAGGVFLVIAVNAFRLSADSDTTKRNTGTGGFALLGESTLPIYEDLNSEAAWDTFALDDKLMKEASVVPFRVREGDDASCLNLNRAQNPVLTAVNPAPLTSTMKSPDRFAFASGSWSMIAGKAPAGEAIPAIADQATALWGLGKGVGDTLTYTDAAGKEFQVKLVALLAGSVLQGKLVISEENYLARFPDAAGYRFFLIDAPSAKAAEISAHLTKQIQTRGLALEPASDRLAAFMAVQNTYIGIFTVLGGLGVLLGTAGLGVLAARNILERKGEFGVMQALGFLPSALRRMVLSEHAALLAAGLALGLLSAALAVWPNVQQSGGALPVGFLLWLNVGILAFGVAVCWLAARLALSGRLLDAVRRE